MEMARRAEARALAATAPPLLVPRSANRSTALASIANCGARKRNVEDDGVCARVYGRRGPRGKGRHGRARTTSREAAPSPAIAADPAALRQPQCTPWNGRVANPRAAAVPCGARSWTRNAWPGGKFQRRPSASSGTRPAAARRASRRTAAFGLTVGGSCFSAASVYHTRLTSPVVVLCTRPGCRRRSLPPRYAAHAFSSKLSRFGGGPRAGGALGRLQNLRIAFASIPWMCHGFSESAAAPTLR